MEIRVGARGAGLFPPLSTEGVVAAAFIPDDGYLDPSQLTFSLADARAAWARSWRCGRR